MITIYHNPRCSKSRETLQLLRDRGIEPQVIEYLASPPSEPELPRLLQLLGLTPGELVRRKEAVFRQAGLDHATDDAILRAMTEHPELIERPIVVAGARAALGRPPENILNIL